MGLFGRLFGRSREPARDPAPEHAVLVTLSLSDDEHGAEEEREEIHALTDRLDEAIRYAGAGEFDGDVFGGGTCTLYMYGPDADALYRAVEPELRVSPLCRGAEVLLRYGAADDPAAREERRTV
jgi:hypothetical protein